MRSKLLIVLFLLTVLSAKSQNIPFPQNGTYSYGYKPTTVLGSNAATMYAEWKAKFVVDCSGMKRVTYEDVTHTASEGTGYGMVLAAYHGDKATYDGLLAYYKSKCGKTAATGGLMSWETSCSGYLGGGADGSATDGDIDVAYSLLVANAQWGSIGTYNYNAEASYILDILKTSYIVSCGGILVVKPGYTWGGCDLHDVSYYAPGYFRLFATFTGDATWTTLADNSYSHLWKHYNRDVKNVLCPDWQNSDGIPGGGGRADYYGWDASRVPWRMSLDYIWNGTALAGNWCKLTTNWANSIGITNLKSSYSLDGTLKSGVTQYHTAAHVGGMAAGAMCNTQAMANAFATELYATNGDKSYFNFTLRCIYMLQLTGNFWKPSVSAFSMAPDGNYTIKSKSNVYLTAVTSGALLNSRTTENANYTKFAFKHLGYNVFEIKSLQFAGQRLEVPSAVKATPTTGVKIGITTFTGVGANLKWKATKVGSYFQFEPMHNLGYAIDANPTYPTIVQIYTKATTNSNQLFSLINSSGVALKNGENTNLEYANIINSDVLVYPNPATDLLYISGLKINLVELYSLDGRKLKSIYKNQEILEVSISDLQSGLYLVRIVGENNFSQTLKFIKK